MQVQNIQRPSLYTDFFNLDLMWNSEYLEYIQTTSKNVTSFLNITKKSIKKQKQTQSHNNALSLM
ncbi:MAG: hypothetical protein Q7R95_03810 [bacterium]|nr:hypothetical protein [bacterium]